MVGLCAVAPFALETNAVANAQALAEFCVGDGRPDADVVPIPPAATSHPRLPRVNQQIAHFNASEARRPGGPQALTGMDEDNLPPWKIAEAMLAVPLFPDSL
jgi:hypothetical protein